MLEPLKLSARPNAKMTVGQAGTGNYIIQGDSRIVLGAMQAEYRGLVRCIYIDPPYNNQEVYTHYSDDGDHDQWLAEIEGNLRVLWPLLRPDGSIWISIDDGEAHYLKVLCDKVFGRQHFITTVIWQHRKSRENRRVFSNNHEYVLVYAMDPVVFAAARNALPLTAEIAGRYKNPDNDPRGAWQSVTVTVQAGHAVASQFYEIVSPSGRRLNPPEGRCWAYARERMLSEIEAGNVWFGSDGNGVPRLKKFLRDVNRGLTPETLWLADDVGTTHEAKREILKLFPGGKPFDTPKPERLIARILDIATAPGDLVVDAYLGSGTTAAVAHKMGRAYVGIEQGDHAASLCVTRMRRVVAGEQGGASRNLGWTGGGGCDFVRWESAPSVAASSGR